MNVVLGLVCYSVAFGWISYREGKMSLQGFSIVLIAAMGGLLQTLGGIQ